MTARRADATRNRERILDAARAAFAEPGADVSMAEVARRAGVGMATLYRNFPGRRELLETLYTDEVDTLCAAESATLEEWLRRFFAYFASKRLIASALLEHADRSDPLFGRNRARVLASGQPLLDAAQQAGEIRPDVTLEQVLDLVGAIAKIPGDEAYVEPILATALAGLRPPQRVPGDANR